MDKAIELSEEIDLTPQGIVFWKDTYFEPIKGVYLDLVLGSDEFLDALLDGTLENYLKFFN